MNFLSSLNPFASLGENILPENNGKKTARFANTVNVKEFQFKNAPSNVKNANRNTRTLTNNTKNTRKAYGKGYARRINANTRRNIKNYERNLNLARRQNYYTSGRALTSNANNAESRRFLRQKQPQMKFPAGALGYTNFTNNLTRKMYKPISNKAAENAAKWGKKVHLNEYWSRYQ